MLRLRLLQHLFPLHRSSLAPIDSSGGPDVQTPPTTGGVRRSKRKSKPAVPALTNRIAITEARTTPLASHTDTTEKPRESLCNSSETHLLPHTEHHSSSNTSSSNIPVVQTSQELQSAPSPSSSAHNVGDPSNRQTLDQTSTNEEPYADDDDSSDHDGPAASSGSLDKSDDDAVKGHDDNTAGDSKTKQRGEWQEVSLDELDIDEWDMPRPWANETGKPIWAIYLEQQLYTGSTCGVGHFSGIFTPDGAVVHYIGKAWRNDNLEGLFAEYALYQSPQHLQPLQGDVVPHLIGAYLMPGGVSLAMELPHSVGWNPEEVPLYFWRYCVSALEKVHAQGILHGNLQWRHFIVGLDARVTIVGFRHARALVPMPEYGVGQATQAELNMEMQKFKWMVDFRGFGDTETNTKRLAHLRLLVRGSERTADLRAQWRRENLPLLSKKEAQHWLDSIHSSPQGRCVRVQHQPSSDSRAFADACLKFRKRTRYLMTPSQGRMFDAERAFPVTFKHFNSTARKISVYVVALPLPPQFLPFGTNNLHPHRASPLRDETSSTFTTSNLGQVTHTGVARMTPTTAFSYTPLTTFFDAECFSKYLEDVADKHYNETLAKFGISTWSMIRDATRDQASALGLTFPRSSHGFEPGVGASTVPLSRTMRTKLRFHYPTWRKKMEHIKTAWHKMKLERKRLVARADRPEVTNGPPILTPDELDERKKALRKDGPQPAAPGVPPRSALKRPLGALYVDWEEYRQNIEHNEDEVAPPPKRQDPGWLRDATLDMRQDIIIYALDPDIENRPAKRARIERICDIGGAMSSIAPVEYGDTQPNTPTESPANRPSAHPHKNSETTSMLDSHQESRHIYQATETAFKLPPRRC